ncbi:hypothetical protein GHT06_010719 [Daphnia sinensis]|uniref:Uncharacterized protein n=1 Tax=Daphnia sinensis TaxID=1820382 RepID=A0AAD5LIA7_9CRUS|nr:hypothetical protein GHT06_010719 [Daphnia sinensis]
MKLDMIFYADISREYVTNAIREEEDAHTQGHRHMHTEEEENQKNHTRKRRWEPGEKRTAAHVEVETGTEEARPLSSNRSSIGENGGGEKRERTRKIDNNNWRETSDRSKRADWQRESLSTRLIL